MPFVGGGHIWLLLILLVIVLIVKGPGKLPEVGSALGKGLREFKNATSAMHDAAAAPPQEPTLSVVSSTTPAENPAESTSAAH